MENRERKYAVSYVLVTDRSSSGDHADPTDDGDGASDTRAGRCERGLVPSTNSTINAVMKEQRVEAGQRQEQELPGEEQAVIEPHGFRPRQQRSGNEHEGEAAKGPRQHFAHYTGHRRSQAETEQPRS